MENFNEEEKKSKKSVLKNLSENKSNNSKVKVLKYIVLIAVLGVTYLGVFYLGNMVATKGVIMGTVPEKAIDDLSQVGDISKYYNLFNLRNMLFSTYDGEIDDEKLLEGAMKGMADAIGDPYTVYMNQDEFITFIESSQGSFYGIGAQLVIRDNNVSVIAPVEGSPAE